MWQSETSNAAHDAQRAGAALGELLGVVREVVPLIPEDPTVKQVEALVAHLSHAMATLEDLAAFGAGPLRETVAQLTRAVQALEDLQRAQQAKPAPWQAADCRGLRSALQNVSALRCAAPGPQSRG